MKLIIFAALSLLGLAHSAPTSAGDVEHLTDTNEFDSNSSVLYTGKHDIVSIVVPLNSLNFAKESSDITIFFAEADIDENRKRTDQGLYVLKGGKAKKILDNGRDAAASADKSKTVYLAASDGLYTYKQEDQTAEKYGSITDSIIGIAHEAKTDVMYILTEDNSVYKVTDNGNGKVKLEDVVNAQQIVLDYSNNLYFYTPDKKVHVRTSEGVKDIEGLPENPSKVTLVKPPMLFDNGVLLFIDNFAYIVYSNGTCISSGTDSKLKTKPTAYGLEAAFIQYYGYNKKIYEYNILIMIFDSIFAQLNDYLDKKINNILNIAKDIRKK